ncbi:hypothetical protein [Qipengyuania flava]|uniref:hypothetical protein n=1 Tax=Qipengyuania flava TaxID=192812 RepID=UPI0012FDFF47|nr:hypothetical protein [Qipengyuania flava]
MKALRWHRSPSTFSAASILIEQTSPHSAQIRCSLWQASAGTNAFNEAMRSTRCAQINRSMLR